MGKATDKINKFKAKTKITLKPASVFESAGRIFCFLGLVGLLAAFIASFVSIGSRDTVTTITPAFGGGSDLSVLSVALLAVGVVVVVAFLVYGFYWVNRFTRTGLEFIAKVGKTSVLRVEIALSCTLYALTAALLVASAPAYMMQACVICASGVILSVGCFIVAYLISRPKSSPDDELKAQMAKALEK